MFFSQELLSRRDSGFGLLWLAATLGSTAAFKKLPKRSILTADISQLCDLISKPSEPLALRLSSNLLVGAARVYKVKQDIFLTDVTACFTSLKKVVQDMKTSISVDTQLQMAQPSVRPSAVTLSTDPKVAVAVDFDALVADWDAYLNIGDILLAGVRDNRDFDAEPTLRKKKNDSRARAPEKFRADNYTLTEHYDHLLSASFDISYQGSHDNPSASSSQGDVNLGFNDIDDLFALPSDGLDIDGLADELAKELGWVETPSRNKQRPTAVEHEDADMHSLLDFVFQDQSPISNDQIYVDGHASLHPDEERPTTEYPCVFEARELSPATSFSRMLLSQDEFAQQTHSPDVKAVNNQPNPDFGPKSLKRTRLLLDTRTELTDDELKLARARYLQDQDLLRRGIGNKILEKNRSQIMLQMIWGVPNCIHAPTLVNFWKENFKIQVDARYGTAVKDHEEPPRKRRKSDDVLEKIPFAGQDVEEVYLHDHQSDTVMDDGIAMGNEDPNLYNFGLFRSSEEPGQGRRVDSKPPSAFGDVNLELGIQEPVVGSQKSSLFPWDHAGGSSTSGAFGMPESHDMAVDLAEVRLRGSSQNERRSSVGPSQLESVVGGRGYSPASVTMQDSQAIGEDFRFHVETQDHSATLESQRSDVNFTSLERNSFNFLEYVKMQSHSLPSSMIPLTFEVVVPRSTSTRHVAASALYHCLVLATKDLLRLKQMDAYGSLIISVV